ncbi:MAG TPA: hypothetical protein VN887_02305, partial [Candidatus Angelobacter sp.]|nr:hypothetical protein [Candidatus Angelobacter sp.]
VFVMVMKPMIGEQTSTRVVIAPFSKDNFTLLGVTLSVVRFAVGKLSRVVVRMKRRTSRNP